MATNTWRDGAHISFSRATMSVIKNANKDTYMSHIYWMINHFEKFGDVCHAKWFAYIDLEI